MVVLLEFTIDAENFALGDILQQADGIESVELERVVPLGGQAIPYLWVTGDDFEQFERDVVAHPLVESIHGLERVDGRALYRVEWTDESIHHLLDGLKATEATLLESRGGREWFFCVRFPSHRLLGAFYNYCIEHDIAVHVDRVASLSERPDDGSTLDLSSEQQEALLLAIDRGYFDTPRRVTLDELAAEFDISQQAMSDRIRRGVKEVLTDVLESAADG